MHVKTYSRLLARVDCGPMATMSRFRLVHCAAPVAGVVLACAIAAGPVRAQDAAACRELGRKYDLMNADITSVQVNSVLFSAASAGCVELARRLLAAGASLEARDRLGAMPLAHAARTGQRALVELFLAEGAPVDARNLAGSTALYAAAENQRQATVAVLLAKGADPDLPGRSGVTPLAAAAFNGGDRIVEQLLARGAKADIVDTTGKSAITYAAARGFAEIVRRLIDAGVDAKTRYGNDLTALMWAAGHEDGVGARAAEDVVALLLDHGAPIDAVDNRGRTALMMAAELGHAEMVEGLIRRGADQSVKDKAGKSAFDLAANAAVREKLATR
jgi:ankyrin repeat protein